MRPLSFRKRILLVLLLLGALPTLAGIVGWGVALRNTTPAMAGRAAFEEVGASGRNLFRALDTTQLSAAERARVRDHAATLSRALARAQRAEAFSRIKAYGLTLVLAVVGTVLVLLAIRLGRQLSRQLSAPIDELIGWAGIIQRGEPLPAPVREGGAPEFSALRRALREMAATLQAARQRELEAERLRAFREVARRVAHEMRNPLTPVRFALRQLEATALPAQREALDVLATESARLEQLAREFATLGRLPEGPAAAVDLAELLGELLRTSVPEGVTTAVRVTPEVPAVTGHYDPLRRAFANLIRNAVEAMGGEGRLDVHVGAEAHWVVVHLADSGPGIPPEKRGRVFEAYYSDKPAGTGLGLAIVKQAIDHHRGTIAVEDSPGGGATFVVRLPWGPDKDSSA